MEELPIEERRIFTRLNVSIQPTSLTFQRKLNQREMQTLWWLLINLKNRATKEDHYIDFAMGDWLVTAKKWFGEECMSKWVEEEKKQRKGRDVLLALMGAALGQLQVLDLTINACCSFLSLETRKRKIKIKPDELLSGKGLTQETIGTLKDALLGTGAFNDDFENRLKIFVANRNHFIHHFWLDLTKDSIEGNPPSWSKLKSATKFVSDLIKETGALQLTFHGFYFWIAKKGMKEENKDRFLNSKLFAEFSEQESDFLSTLRNAGNRV